MAGIFNIISSLDFKNLDENKQNNINVQITKIYTDGLGNITIKNLNTLYETLIKDVYSTYSEKENNKEKYRYKKSGKVKKETKQKY